MSAEKIINEMRGSGVAIPFYALKRHPWHYVFFSQFNWYRKLVGGNWKYVNPDGSLSVWMRFE